MRNLVFTIFLGLMYCSSYSQEMVMKTPMDSVTDMTMQQSTYCNILSGGAKYLTNSALNTRDLLAGEGFTLNEIAIEYQIRYKDLPKLFYFQQLGTVKDGKYASINGFGIKEDIRKSIVKTDNLILTPYAEFGVGYFRLTAVDGIDGSSISTVLSGDVSQRTLDNITVTGDIGLDFGFGFNFDNKRMMLIFSGGFMTNFPTQWRNAGSAAFNEKLSILSPYAGLGLALDMNCKGGCCKK